MPPRKTTPELPDPVVFGPPRDEPGPQASPQQNSPAPAAPNRPRRPRRGPVELAVTRDLAPLPDSLRKGGVAAAALRLAHELDRGIVIGRDAAGHVREIRQCLTVLREWAPVASQGDKTDRARDRRETRLELVSGG
jgi:hypothetical protein